MERSWRLYLAWGVAVITMWTLAFRASHGAPFTNNEHESPRSAVEALSTWDGTAYEHIAKNGYSTAGDERRFFNFFPLYPTIVGALGGTSHAMLAGVLLSQLLTLASMLLMSGMVHGTRSAPLLKEPGFWMIVSPFGFFLFSFYTEATFLFLTLVHYAAFRANRPRLSFAAGFLAGMTRPTGLILGSLLGFEALRRLWRGEKWHVALICACAPALGIATYILGFVGWMTGDLFGYMKVSDRYFPRTFVMPLGGYLQSLGLTIEKAGYGLVVSFSILIKTISTTAIIAVLVTQRKNLQPALLAYAVATMLFVYAIFPATGTGRFEVVLFPVFFAIAASRLARSRAAWLIVAASLYLCVKAFMHFAAWDWIA